MKPAGQDKLESQLAGYLAGRLGSRQAAEIERRLGADPALQAELRRYAALDPHTPATGRQELPEADCDVQRAQIVATLERKMLLHGRGGRRRVLRLVFCVPLGAAAVVLGVVLLSPLFRSPSQPAGSVEIVQAGVLPIAAVGVGDPSAMEVSFRRMNPDELRDVAAPPATAGTVLVCTGLERRMQSAGPIFPDYYVIMD